MTTLQLENSIGRSPLHRHSFSEGRSVMTYHYPATSKPSEGGSLLTILRLRRGFLLIALALTCFGISLTAQALLPPPAPDGGYPGGNTAEGDFALFNLTSGMDNTATGRAALYSNTAGTLNTASGSGALLRNTTGAENTANGFQALFSNTTGNANTAGGVNALFSNNTGSDNTASGFEALQNNTIGFGNTATGFNALFRNTTGNSNTATGVGALETNISGINNTATGIQALAHNTANYNTATGSGALLTNTTGTNNTAHGLNALYFNATGNSNTADGFSALLHNTGSNNIALGANAGSNLTTGSNNIDIGAPGVAGESAKIRIGKQGTQNGTFIAGIAGVAVTGNQVVVNSNGKLGITVSSARYKEAIKPMGKASEAILALKPVTFRNNQELDPDGMPQFGLIAEEVEKVNADLVVRDEDGKVNTVRYEAVNAMLLNEFLKEHRNVAEQQSTIAELRTTVAQQQKQIEALAATVRKVSERVELSVRAPQIAANED